jgi:hypothetical protein
MSARTILIVLVVCVSFLNGCAGLVTRSNSNSKPAKGSSNSAGATASSSEKIGIPECDDFIAKYNACISDHLPEAKKAEYKENIDAFARTWKQLMANSDRSTVAAACKRHSDMARENMKSFGCEF